MRHLGLPSPVTPATSARGATSAQVWTSLLTHKRWRADIFRRRSMSISTISCLAAQFRGELRNRRGNNDVVVVGNDVGYVGNVISATTSQPTCSTSLPTTRVAISVRRLRCRRGRHRSRRGRQRNFPRRLRNRPARLRCRPRKLPSPRGNYDVDTVGIEVVVVGNATSPDGCATELLVSAARSGRRCGRGGCSAPSRPAGRRRRSAGCRAGSG